MYEKQSLLIFLAFICLTNCQLQFPEQHNGASTQSANLSLIQRNTEENRALVSDVISKGVLNLALSLDKILSSNAIKSDVKVYSPVGIAGIFNFKILFFDVGSTVFQKKNHFCLKTNFTLVLTMK